MNKLNALFAENENFKFISVVFSPFTGTRTYTYKTTLDVQEGDFVIVDTPNGGLSVVQVKKLNDFTDVNFNVTYGYKWVVQKIDRTDYDELVVKEKQLAKTLNKVTAKKVLHELRTSLLEDMSEEEQTEVKALTRL